MSFELLLGVAVGVGIGYVIAKKMDNLPVLMSGGKQLDGTDSVKAAYYMGVSDGKVATPYLGQDVIGYLRTGFQPS
jgi:hypothetical protein